jgi:hypothetical protein
MNTMTLYPEQYVEDTTVVLAAPVARIGRNDADAGLARRLAPIRMALTGAAVYAVSHLLLLALGITAELVPGIGLLALAVLILALVLQRRHTALALLATASLVATVALVHPEMTVMPLLAAALQLAMLVLLAMAELVDRHAPAPAFNPADFAMLKGSL